ncbi:MAG: DUF1080 domain-containing protein [Planctomycetaceae bacterium]
MPECFRLFAPAIVAAALLPPAAFAVENALSADEKADGWVLLFDGTSLEKFRLDPKRDYFKWVAEDGVLTNKPAIFPMDPNYSPFVLFTVEEYGDFALKFDFHFGPDPEAGHSGVILKTAKPHSYTPNDVTVALFGPARKPGHFCTGAFRFHLKPVTKDAMKSAGEWNTMTVTAKAKQVTVVLNGEQINDLDMSQWTEPKKRPDGTPHLVPLALNDLPTTSPIGFRDDYGIPIYLRNLKIKPLE